MSQVEESKTEIKRLNAENGNLGDLQRFNHTLRWSYLITSILTAVATVLVAIDHQQTDINIIGLIFLGGASIAGTVISTVNMFKLKKSN
jgi:hypothetical protein